MDIYQNNITYVELLGFHKLTLKFPFFFLLLVLYCVNIFGNVLIIILNLVSKTLQSPMYFFITQLSFLDIMLATDILPNFLHIVLYDGVTMSLAGCIIQFSIFGSSEISECLLLALMSYDRYLAICRPLHYNSIIDQVFCLKSVVSIWLLGFQFMLVDSVSICYLYFCGPNTINHFYCDLEPILELSCSDTTWIRGQTIVIAFICIIAPFAVITLSYVYIGVTIIKIPSVTGRQKAFTTCSSHLMGVSLFYGTLIAVYLSPTRGQFYVLSKVLSMFYTVITPMLNPIIYTFRNKDFKTALGQLKYRLGMQAITVLIRT